jgi:electron transfer flavoprotein beta subunit
MKVVAAEGVQLGTHAVADLLARVIADGHDLLPADLILTGTQAIDDLDGLMAPLVAHQLGLPYIAIVTQVTPDPAGKVASIVKEYAGGVRGRFEIDLPAVVGIGSAERPPRYVPVAKVRAAMKTQRIEIAESPTLADGGLALAQIKSMSKPDETGRAEMIEGTPEAASLRLCGILAERGLV